MQPGAPILFTFKMPSAPGGSPHWALGVASANAGTSGPLVEALVLLLLDGTLVSAILNHLWQARGVAISEHV